MFHKKKPKMKKFLLCTCLMLFSLMASATMKETVVKAPEVDIGYISPITTSVINLENGTTFQIENSVVFTDCQTVLSNQLVPFSAIEQVNAIATINKVSYMPYTTFRQRCTENSWISNYRHINSYNGNRYRSWPCNYTYIGDRA